MGIWYLHYIQLNLKCFYENCFSALRQFGCVCGNWVRKAPAVRHPPRLAGAEYGGYGARSEAGPFTTSAHSRPAEFLHVRQRLRVLLFPQPRGTDLSQSFVGSVEWTSVPCESFESQQHPRELYAPAGVPDLGAGTSALLSQRFDHVPVEINDNPAEVIQLTLPVAFSFTRVAAGGFFYYPFFLC